MKLTKVKATKKTTTIKITNQAFKTHAWKNFSKGINLLVAKPGSMWLIGEEPNFYRQLREIRDATNNSLAKLLKKFV